MIGGEKGSVSLLTACGAGLYSAMALGAVNCAAHRSDWGARLFFALSGLYAALVAVRLAGQRRVPSAVSSRPLSFIVILGAILPFAARPSGRVLWEGGLWLGAAGAAVALLAAVSLGEHFGIAPANRGTVSRGPYGVVRHPMAASFVLLSAGYLLVQYSAWNAAVLGVSAVVALASAVVEERLLRKDAEYLAYAARVRFRFVPGLL